MVSCNLCCVYSAYSYVCVSWYVFHIRCIVRSSSMSRPCCMRLRVRHCSDVIRVVLIRLFMHVFLVVMFVFVFVCSSSGVSSSSSC